MRAIVKGLDSSSIVKVKDLGYDRIGKVFNSGGFMSQLEFVANLHDDTVLGIYSDGSTGVYRHSDYRFDTATVEVLPAGTKVEVTF